MSRRSVIGLGVATASWLSLLLFGTALATNWAMPPDDVGGQSDLCHRGQIMVVPAAPTTADPVSIVVSGWWGSSCPQVTYEPRMIGYSITLSMTVTDISTVPPTACLDVVTPWTVTHELGTLLPGDYTVQANCRAGTCWSFLAWGDFHVSTPTEARWEQYLPVVLQTAMALE